EAAALLGAGSRSASAQEPDLSAAAERHPISIASDAMELAVRPDEDDHGSSTGELGRDRRRRIAVLVECTGAMALEAAPPSQTWLDSSEGLRIFEPVRDSNEVPGPTEETVDDERH